jgi:hypothetical protein
MKSEARHIEAFAAPSKLRKQASDTRRSGNAEPRPPPRHGLTGRCRADESRVKPSWALGRSAASATLPPAGARMRCASASRPSGVPNAVRLRPAYHFPVFGIDFHGSRGGSGSPFCNSSTDCLSGERTNAIMPSRGGRLMVTPAAIRRSHRA